MKITAFSDIRILPALNFTLRNTRFVFQKFYAVITYVEFVCLVWISEQTANFVLCNIKILFFYNRGGECFLRGTHRVLM